MNIRKLRCQLVAEMKNAHSAIHFSEGVIVTIDREMDIRFCSDDPECSYHWETDYAFTELLRLVKGMTIDELQNEMGKIHDHFTFPYDKLFGDDDIPF